MFQFIVLQKKARPIAPTAPTAAASDAVASPPRIVPKTKAIIKNNGKKETARSL